ncbi:MAG: RNA polymerase sigma factor [Myxococcaceae bacterium]
MVFDSSAVERVFKEKRGRMLATLIRLIGDIDLAEDALAAALEAALRQWPKEGAPENPSAWLIQAARNKAVDALRLYGSAERKREELQSAMAPDFAVPSPDEADVQSVGDDVLRLIFTCCHPALALEAQVALTLRTLGGLKTEEIARAFLVPTATMAQRLVRAKQKIRSARIPYRVPEETDLPERIISVMTVIYLIFNEGYSASSGDGLVRQSLAVEAIRLGRLLCDLMPRTPVQPAELSSGPRALLALMLLHDSRRHARVNAAGDLVLLEEQNRVLWDMEEIREGLRLLDEVFLSGPADAYAVQAAIAATHARAVKASDTDWNQIVALYARLFSLSPSPVIMLNHAVAVAMSDGPEHGLHLLEQLRTSGFLKGYHLLPAARADLLRRLGRNVEARAAYQEALALVGNDAERRFLQKRLALLT